MRESFQGLVDALKKNREKCPWEKQLNIERMSQELLDEAQELKEAVNNKDFKNLKEEI